MLPAQAADVKAARVWAGPEYTRVVFDLSGPVQLPGHAEGGRGSCSISATTAWPPVSTPRRARAVQGAEHASARQASCELTAKVDAHSKPKSFLLKPSGSYGYRLVLDLYPEAGAGTAPTAAIPRPARQGRAAPQGSAPAT